MMDAVTQVAVWLNVAANGLGRVALAPVAVTPAWLSVTAVSVVTGVLMLLAFKYTSPQRAIKRVRDDITANLLALKLFKDNTSVALQAQGRLLVAAGRLFALALLPMAVLIPPVTLLLGQLSLWYDRRPLPVGEEAVVTLRLGGGADDPFPEASVRTSDGVEAVAGPVRVRADGGRELWWTVRPRRAGYHHLSFQVGGQEADKELAAGDGVMRVSDVRPQWSCIDILMHPAEPPLSPGAAVQSIEIQYPERDWWAGAGESWLTGWFPWVLAAAGWVGGFVGLPAWMAYWFVVSLLTGLCFSRVLKVKF